MNIFVHGSAIRWRAAAVTQAVGRGLTVLSALILLALLATGPAIAQRAVLYDEDPSDPNGQKYLGSVTWRTEIIKLAGQSDDVAVRADVDIPLRKFKMTLLLRRNLDKSLPASHVVELTFHLPPDFAGGGIGNVPGILMKSNELARGIALAGPSVKVTDGFFMVGLSNVVADRERNLQTLQRAWFDIPIVYANQRRAIAAIEKGESGEQAFKAAFAAWGEYPLTVQPAPVVTAPLTVQVTPDGRGGTGVYLVQVSSQRSEADAEASYKVLQDKFPGVLGAWSPVITRADAGTSGIFYRAAVGPFETADEAAQFCATLKAAGGQCVVQKN
jgi:SPOR domain